MPITLIKTLYGSIYENIFIDIHVDFHSIQLSLVPWRIFIWRSFYGRKLERRICGGGGAIAGILLVVGLVYFLNRDTDTDEVANELLSQNTKKLKKFEFNFVTNEMQNFSDIGPQNNFALPQNELQLNLKYNLN